MHDRPDSTSHHHNSDADHEDTHGVADPSLFTTERGILGPSPQLQ
jgi:hypothetical protein